MEAPGMPSQGPQGSEREVYAQSIYLSIYLTLARENKEEMEKKRGRS